MDIAKIRKKLKESKKDTNKVSEPEKQQEISKEISAPIKTESTDDHVFSQETVSVQAFSSDIKEKKASAENKNIKSVEIEENEEAIVELLTFDLSKEEFAFRVSDVEEILRSQRITHVPKVPAFIIGITSLRGKMIPVVELRKRLSIEGNNSVSRKKILILKGGKGHFGVLIDKVKNVIRIRPSEIDEPPPHLSEDEQMFIEGVVLNQGRFISIIRMSEIIDGLKNLIK
ncbi:MAG: chemotaxis protein CheW [Nitrospiraceae bacterium]|nr:chemotaxis protein CheW [Nitrospiraceae bacterium]